jgi:predicted Fe-Mo cluster-binding NifX family protein
MKLAIAVWEGRVSGVFDFAQKALLVDLTSDREVGRTEMMLSGQGPGRLARLRQVGVDTVICGAISRPLALRASVCGIRLLPYVTGPVDDVIEAYRKGELESQRFVLPGGWHGARAGLRRRCGWGGGRPHRRS